MTNEHVPPESSHQKDRTLLHRVRRVVAMIARIGKWCAFFVFLYGVIGVVGLFPANRDFRAPDHGVKIYVFSGPVHTDLILPVESPSKDWRKAFPSEGFATSPDAFSHVAIGWGDRGFYLETPTWAELKASNAVKAMLLPSQSVMHVDFRFEPNVRRD